MTIWAGFIMVSIEVIVILLGTVSLGFYYLKTRQNTPRHLKQRVLDYEELLKLKTKESNQWKGRYNAREKGPQVTEFDDKEADLEKIIPDLAQNYIPNAPTWLKPLLSNPDVVKYAVKLAKDNPEKAKELLGKFVGKKLPGAGVQEEVSGL